MVFRLVYQAQVRHQVLDFLTVIEARATDDAVGYVIADECLFDGPALGVSAVQDSEVPIVALAAVNTGTYTAHDALTFVTLRSSLQQLHRQAIASLCP